MRDGGPLDEFERECFIVKLDGEDGPGWGPRPNHQMVKHGRDSRRVAGRGGPVKKNQI